MENKDIEKETDTKDIYPRVEGGFSYYKRDGLSDLLNVVGLLIFTIGIIFKWMEILTVKEFVAMTGIAFLFFIIGAIKDFIDLKKKYKKDEPRVRHKDESEEIS